MKRGCDDLINRILGCHMCCIAMSSTTPPPTPIQEVEDNELAYVASVSAGGNMEVGEMISNAMARVGRRGVISLEESRGVENDLYVVEGVPLCSFPWASKRMSGGFLGIGRDPQFFPSLSFVIAVATAQNDQ